MTGNDPTIVALAERDAARARVTPEPPTTPGTESDWPKCATFPAVPCVCRGAFNGNPTSGTCIRKKNHDFEPPRQPATEDQP